MSKRLPVFLFDLDSVLVEPLGYRKSIQAALGWFTTRMGLGDRYPGEDAIASLEAINMTCEWDITPILLAVVFDTCMQEDTDLRLPEDVLQACDVIRSRGLKGAPITLDAIIPILGGNFRPGMEYASLARDLNRADSATPPFPHLRGHGLIEALLSGTRALDGSVTTRVFQHFTLGSERFAELSGHKPIFESESYLLKYDRLLIGESARRSLLDAWQEQRCAAVIYTARPSLPEEGDAPNYSYSPEAETALEALGLGELPLIAAGKMGWLAMQSGVALDQLTKPSPVQALAAIAAAVTRRTGVALKAAARLFFNHEAGIYTGFAPLSVHVFEDSGGNTASVRRAVDLLNEAGLDCRLSAWGIGDHPEKLKALQNAGASLFPHVDEALCAAFAQEGLSK